MSDDASPSYPTPLIQRRSLPGPPDIPLLRVAAGRDVLRFAVVAERGHVEIGRDDGCGLTLADASVSRRHARLSWEADGFWLEDLGSSNGTFVNDQPVKRQRVVPGDRLEVGAVPLRLDLVSAEELAHLAAVVARLQAAGQDPLTGLLTRAYLDEQLPGLIERCAASGRPISAAFIDLDHFKSINDRFGHACGDDVLRQVSRLLLYGLRDREVCVRYGGEELVIVQEDAAEERAALVAERLRKVVETHDWSRLAEGLAVTVSCGVAEHRPGETVREWLDRADRALYRAKRAGRNRVWRASETEPSL